MANETTPLIQNVPIAPQTERYPHRTLRKVCTALLASACIIVPVLLITPLAAPIFGNPHNSSLERLQDVCELSRPGNLLSHQSLIDVLKATPDQHHVREWSKYYTSGPHLAGKNLSQAEWTRDRWEEFGVLKSTIVSYDVYVNYPQGHRLALLEQNGSNSGKVRYEAKLEEDVWKSDHTSGLKNRIPTFHGYSASGNVTARYIFANYGTYRDFEDLVDAEVDLKGKIALVKYGGVFRGLKVKRAEELGMSGVVIYSDPGDDGFTEQDAEKYPRGPAREPSSVQRGSVLFMSVAAGDPTTPGYPSKPGVPRQDTEGIIPSIPSIPISYEDALPLLRALNGHGLKASNFNQYWQRGGLGYKGVEYNIGPSPASMVLNLVNEQEYVTTPMWDVIGIINGTIEDEVVILGNHRDAWIAGGASDPNSGSAAMNEVVRGLGKAMQAGWKPLRTIVIASWDGEEYGLIGSTEWVEEYLPWLKASAVSYINVDPGVAGPALDVAAAPLLDKVFIDSAHSVQSPNQTIKGQTIGDVWNGRIKTMGSGSDFTAFQDYAGVPCLDLGFRPTESSPVYHYHSNYDSFDWMERFGDPGWHYHVAIAQLWGVLAAKMINSPIISFNATDYAVALERYVSAVEEKVEAAGLDHEEYSLKELKRQIKSALHRACSDLDAQAARVNEEMSSSSSDTYKCNADLVAEMKIVNNKYKQLERQFLFDEGLDGRPVFKHAIFAPGLWTGYAGAVFPGLAESLDARNSTNFKRWESIIGGLVVSAAKSL